MIALEDVVVGRLALPSAPRLKVAALTLRQPGVVVVVGRNGSGKSTLLDVLAGVVTPSAGRVLLDGQPLAAHTSITRARSVASLAQEPPRFDDVTVAARIAHGLVPRRGANAPLTGEAMKLVVKAAEDVGVGALLDRRLGQLSGGERRRVHVARALVDDATPCVILDEPFAGLDRSSSRSLIEVLQARAQRHLVVVTVHEVALALALGGRLLGLSEGSIVVDDALPQALERAAHVWGDVKLVSEGDYVGVLEKR